MLTLLACKPDYHPLTKKIPILSSMNFLIELPWDLFGKLFLAGFLGAIIGIERDLSGRPAGLRTNLIIAVSSCLFTILSIYAFDGSGTDTSRIASQIVVGVGFLGAGALMHHKTQVLGLTTAADIWLVAAVGMAVGTGFVSLAIFVSIFSVAAIVLLGPLSHKLEGIGQARMKKKNLKTVKQSQR